MEASTVPVFVGRQPIFDRRSEVRAYELLYRSGDQNRASFSDGEQATAQVILNTFLEIGIEQVVGPRLAFINVTRAFLLSGHWRLLPQERVVLEVLEDVGGEPEVTAAMAAIRDQGYTLALDDFVLSEARRCLIDHADIIKIDIHALGPEGAARQVELLRDRGIELIAEKVETAEELALCQELGFHYFQGYHFCKPQVLSGRRIAPDRLGALRLVAALGAPEVDLDHLEGLIKSDLSLSYKLLRLINAASYGLSRRISSVREAVLLLGLRRVKAWAALIVLAGLCEKPRELLTTAMVRARMCERLAMRRAEADPERFFTAGLLSLLDALLDQPLSDILPLLPLSQEIGEALLTRAGRIGEVLGCVVAYERADWDAVRCQGVEPAAIRAEYLESIRFAGELGSATSEPA